MNEVQGLATVAIILDILFDYLLQLGCVVIEKGQKQDF